MKTRIERWTEPLAALVILGSTVARAFAQAGGGAAPPRVTITWPDQGEGFGGGTVMRVEAQATPGDHPIAFVQFLGDGSPFATATNLPYRAMWTGLLHSGPTNLDWKLEAVAVDDTGLAATSAIISGFVAPEGLPTACLRIISPQAGSVLAAPATFAFSADLLSSGGEAGPVEFLVGTNSLGTVTQADPYFTIETPPYSLAVTNLPVGTYQLYIRYQGWSVHRRDYDDSATIRVTKLGIQSPSLRSDGRVQFGVVTSFPGKATVIEASPDLANWSPIATNVPPTNTFTFTDPSPATNGTRFYRAVIPSQ